MLKAHIRITTALAGAALLIATAGTANAVRASRSPTTVGTSTTTKQQGHPSPNYGSGGHSWCYWHPYQCHYR